MNKYRINSKLISQRMLAPDIYDCVLAAPEIAAIARAGQFVNIYVGVADKLLPRPISLCGIDRPAGTIRLVYRVTGPNSGTAILAAARAGAVFTVIGPLGNGFEAAIPEPALLIGGGIGLPPLLELARERSGGNIIVAGYRDQPFLDKELARQGDLYIATEDGSRGTRGTVIDAIRAGGLSAPVIYACGPTPMLRAVKQYAGEQGITACYLSLEERMACGIGACLACVCQSTAVDEHSRVRNKRVCKEGPVFLAGEVEL